MRESALRKMRERVSSPPKQPGLASQPALKAPKD